MTSLNAHGIVAVIELIFYLVLLIPCFFNLFRYGIARHWSWLFLALFAAVKIAGAAMLINITLHPTASIGLQVATQILYGIALGPLLNATLAFLNPRDPDKKSTKRSSPRPRRGLLSLLQKENLPHLLRLVHILITVAIVLGVIAGINRAPGPNGKISNPSKYDSGATYMKASAILLLIAYLAITYGFTRFFLTRASLPEPNRTLILWITPAIPLLGLRVLYSVLGAFNLSTSTQRRSNMWNMFQGSVAAYVLMAAAEQVGVVLCYTIGGFVARGREESVAESARYVSVEHGGWAGAEGQHEMGSGRGQQESGYERGAYGAPTSGV